MVWGVFHNRLSALALSEVGDAPCGYMFGYFILDKQNKVSRLRAKENGSNFTIAPNPLPLAGEGLTTRE